MTRVLPVGRTPNGYDRTGYEVPRRLHPEWPAALGYPGPE